MTKLFRSGDRPERNDRIVCLTDGDFRTSEQASIRFSWWLGEARGGQLIILESARLFISVFMEVVSFPETQLLYR